jgi:hypothetical protein
MKLIWHADHLIEEDWLRYIFGNVIDSEFVDLDMTCFVDNSVHVVSSLWAPLSAYTDYFKQCRERCKHLVLVHVSDEYFSGGYRLYQYFDLVVRWNHTYLADSPGIVTVPLGYPNGTGHASIPADQRNYAWSFIGQIKSSRIAMAAAFDGFTPQFLTRTDSLAQSNPKRLSKAEFDAVLAASVFAPCPMGNATIDTTRVYESLEFGCIPLVEIRPTLDYYTNLLGPHPMPTFRNWSDARRYAENLFNDKPALLRKQAEIVQWWTNYKSNMCAQTQAAMTGPSHAADLQQFANGWRNRSAALHEPLRLAEILRHQTAGSLARRLARPGGPLKRIVLETLRIGSPKDFAR